MCRELGISSLLRVDLEALRASGENPGELIRALQLQRRLHGAGLYLGGFESLFDKEHKPLPDARRLVKLMTDAQRPMFIPCEANTPWRELLGAEPAVCFRFDLPDYAMRLQLWQNAVETVDAKIAGAELEALADRFVLTPAQISSPSSRHATHSICRRPNRSSLCGRQHSSRQRARNPIRASAVWRPR